MNLLKEKKSDSIVAGLKPFGWIIAGAAAGAALTYFLDPQSGRKRREAVLAKGDELLSSVSVFGRRVATDIKDRGQDALDKVTELSGKVSDMAVDAAHDVADTATDSAADFSNNAKKKIDGVKKRADAALNH